MDFGEFRFATGASDSAGLPGFTPGAIPPRASLTAVLVDFGNFELVFLVEVFEVVFEVDAFEVEVFIEVDFFVELDCFDVPSNSSATIAISDKSLAGVAPNADKSRCKRISKNFVKVFVIEWSDKKFCPFLVRCGNPPSSLHTAMQMKCNLLD